MRQTASLVALSSLAGAMLGARFARTGSDMFSFLAFNLALAWIPVALAWSTTRLWRRGLRAPALASGIAWWLFFPNAFYLVTDLVHLRERRPVPLWFDVALMVAFGAAGTALAVASLARMHGEVERRLGARLGWSFVALVVLSAGFGIWLGRVKRLNSWDVLLAPGEVLRVAGGPLVHPLRHVAAWLVTAAFGATLGAIYVAVRAQRAAADGAPLNHGSGSAPT